MHIISVCRCAKQRNRNSVCKHKSFTFLGLGSNAGSNYLSLYYTERTLIDKDIWNGSDLCNVMSSNEESANTCLFCFHIRKSKYCKIFSQNAAHACNRSTCKPKSTNIEIDQRTRRLSRNSKVLKTKRIQPKDIIIVTFSPSMLFWCWYCL